MNKTSETILFFGNERLATGVTTEAPTLRALIEAGYHVAAVVSSFERGTSRSSRDLEIAEVAKQHGIPVLLPNKPAEIIEQLKGLNAALGVLVAYGQIVPQSIIDIFPKGIINIHPSLLPLHRGPIPLESVILEGATKTGVSLMQLVKAMDAGPVYAQSEVALQGTETKQELADHLLDIGKSMLIDILPEVLNGTIVALPQDDSRATYDDKITKEQGIIDWEKPAEQLEREIRAYAGWPNSRTTLADKDVVITKALVSSESGKPAEIKVNGKQLRVFCSEGALIIEKLKPAGKREMTAEEFLAGNRPLS